MSDVIGAPRQDDQFSDMMGVLRRRKGIVIGGIVVCLLLGGLSIALTSPSYQATSRVLLSDYSDRGFSPSTNAVDKVSQIGVPPTIGSQMSQMQSQEVLQAAFSQANVTLPGSLESAGKIVAVTQENTTPTLDVEVNLPDADSAGRLAAAIPAAFNDSIRQLNQAKAAAATNNVRTRLGTAQGDLNAAQAALEKYLAHAGKDVVASGTNEGAERTGRLNSFDQQLQSARVAVDAAESDLQASLAAQSRIPATIKDVSKRPSTEQIQSQKKQIADLTAELKAALVTYSEGSPEVRALRTRLKTQQDYLVDIPKITDTGGEVRNPERAGYDQRVAEAKARLASANAQVAKLTGIVADERKGLDDYQKRLPRQRELESIVGQKQLAVNSAAQSLGEISLIAASQVPAAQVISVSSPLKTQPAISRTLIASTVLGLVLGVIAALVRDRLDNRVQTLEQVYDASGAMPIGEVPVSGKPLALQTGAGRNRVLESYRSLRFNLESSGTGAAVQSVLVASASAGEGRAPLALNLASEAATDLRKTILVDADMRAPELHDRLKLKRGPGLSEVLSGAISLQDALQPTGQENLLLLSAGGEHLNPLELLSGPSMAATHEALKEIADVIVFNSPSLMRYSDGRALARVVDSVVFVAKRGFTRRDAMRYCVGMLRRAQARLLGVVLVDERGRTSDVPYFATE